MPNTAFIGGQLFHYKQLLAVKGHSLPGYLIKWGQQQFTFFDEREEMENWFTRVKADCFSRNARDSRHSKDNAFMPLEVVYEGQRCGFYADIECYTPPMMSTEVVDTLKADIVRYVNTAYAARGLDSGALLWSENHRGDKVSFHVVGRDVDFEGTHGDSDLARVAKKMNRDCIELTKEHPRVGFSECGRTGRKQNLFDLKVYANNRAMRCIYSSKTGSEDSCFTPCAGFEGRELGEWYIVREVGSTRRVHSEPWTIKLERDLANRQGTKMTTKTFNKKAFKRVMQSPTVPSKATDAQEQLAQRLQKYFQEEQKDGTITVRFYGEYHRDGYAPADSYRLDGKNRHCQSCSGTHTSNGGGESQRETVTGKCIHDSSVACI